MAEQTGSERRYMGQILDENPGAVVFATAERSASVRSLRFSPRSPRGSRRELRKKHAESVGVPSRIGQIRPEVRRCRGGVHHRGRPDGR